MARDPLKLVVDVSGAEADGIALDRALRARGVQVEGADRRLIVPHITVGDDAARIEAFLPILRERRRRDPGRRPRPAAGVDLVALAGRAGDDAARGVLRRAPRPFPPSGSQAAWRPSSPCPIRPASRRWPRVRSSARICGERLRTEAAEGARIAFASDPGLQTFRVVAAG